MKIQQVASEGTKRELIEKKKKRHLLSFFVGTCNGGKIKFLERETTNFSLDFPAF